jgi:hypothetical protein
MTEIYVLSPAMHHVAHWGDYGDMLVHGVAQRPVEDGDLELQRTGPYVPRVSFPGICDVVVVEEIRGRLQSHLPDLVFRRVRKSRLVRLNWHEWDTTEEEPLICPESGEPEDYILGQPHDEALESEIGDLWELVPIIDREIQAKGGRVEAARYQGQHLVRTSLGAGINFVSAALRGALLEVASPYVCFQPAQASQGGA